MAPGVVYLFNLNPLVHILFVRGTGTTKDMWSIIYSYIQTEMPIAIDSSVEY